MWGPLQQGGAVGGYQVTHDRAGQIHELLVVQPQCRALNPDRSLLEAGVRLQDGTLTSLRISLPTGFPSDRPALSITSPVRHPWVDSIGRLSFPMLDRWGSQGVSLAAVVADAFKGLGGQPAPPPSKASAAAAQQAGGARPGQQGPGQPPAGAAQQQVSAGRLGGSGPASLSPAGSGASAAGGSTAGRLGQPPAIPSEFSEVAALGDEELSAALTDAAAYQALVQRAQQRLHLWQAVEKLKEESGELAANNLALGEQQAGIRNQMAVVRASDYAPSKAAFDAKWARQQAVLNKLSPEVLMRRLQEAAKEAEDEGERLVSQLGAEEIGVDAFVSSYTKVQATYHQRDLKLQAAQQTLPTMGGR